MNSEIDDTFELIRHELASLDVLLIGGFAVNFYGYTRNTLDIDLMIADKDGPTVVTIMKDAGFTNVSNLDNVIFFNKPGSSLRVDFLKVDSVTMQNLMANSSGTEAEFKGVRIPALKDLLAMKLFALHHAKTRRAGKDLPDIVMLSAINGLDPETELLPLCERYASRELYDEILTQIEELL